MTAAHLHLMVVHLPVVLCPLGLVLLLVDARKVESRPLTGYALLLASAVFGIVAYYSGPYAYEQIEAARSVDKDLVEEHAIVARGAFVVMVLAGVLALQATLQHAQEETPPKILRVAVPVAALLASYLLAWSAHLGGQVSHPEVRESSLPIFPRLGD